MLGAGSFPDLLTRYRYLRLIASYDRTLLRRVGELQVDLEEQNDDLQTSIVSLGRLRQSRLSEVATLGIRVATAETTKEDCSSPALRSAWRRS